MASLPQRVFHPLSILANEPGLLSVSRVLAEYHRYGETKGRALALTQSFAAYARPTGRVFWSAGSIIAGKTAKNRCTHRSGLVSCHSESMALFVPCCTLIPARYSSTISRVLAAIQLLTSAMATEWTLSDLSQEVAHSKIDSRAWSLKCYHAGLVLIHEMRPQFVVRASSAWRARIRLARDQIEVGHTFIPKRRSHFVGVTSRQLAEGLLYMAPSLQMNPHSGPGGRIERKSYNHIDFELQLPPQERHLQRDQLRARSKVFAQLLSTASASEMMGYMLRWMARGFMPHHHSVTPELCPL